VIRVANPSRLSTGGVDIEIDGKAVDGSRFPVTDDGREHRVDVRLRAPEDTTSDAMERRERHAAGGRR
jgi:hypothetical protein